MTGQDLQDQSVRLRGGLSLSISQLNQIQLLIDKMVELIPAKFVLVVDTSGQLVSTSGDKGLMDIPVLGSLIAADLAASEEIARLTGDFQDYQMILREGNKSHIAISEAGKSLAILVAFSRSTPIGWARKLVQSTSNKIGELTGQTFQTDEEALNEAVKGELPDLYNDALDQIWKE